jgi:aspartyl-tRNA(Asn)/glutamyl-tRNA(Gln) amidotransferase subunit A
VFVCLTLAGTFLARAHSRQSNVVSAVLNEGHRAGPGALAGQPGRGGDGWFLVRLAVTPAAVASARFPATNEEIRTTVEASTDLISLSATELIARYAAREISPVEVLDAVLARIDDREPVLNAFSVRETDLARTQAEASAARWTRGDARLIDGVPLTLKENIATVGSRLTAGTAALTDTPKQSCDGPAALATAREGGVRLGKTVMPDFGMLSAGVSSLHGVTRSPWDPAWTVGGSSGGAAAAAAARFGPLHVGSDIGGSVRLPATWTGLASLKPTFGIAPVDPPYMGRVIGPLARTVDDVALAMRVLTTPDPHRRDYTYTGPRNASWEHVADSPRSDEWISGLRIAVHTDAGCGMPTDPVVAEIIGRAARLFERAGASVDRIDPFVTPELLHQLDLFLRMRSWLDVEALPAAKRELIHPYIREWVLGAVDLSGRAVMESYHAVQALRKMTVTATEIYDVVLSPVAPGAAFAAELPSPTNDPALALHHITYTAPYNFSEQPAATLNAGFTPDGRPVGLQLAGRRYEDVRLLQTARWFEHARPASARPTWPR